jgi:hypothetical protein
VTSDTETGDITGTKDKDYIIIWIWFTEACLSNALHLETHILDAERAGDTELADFFRRARQKVARCRAEQAASSCPARELTFNLLAGLSAGLVPSSGSSMARRYSMMGLVALAGPEVNAGSGAMRAPAAESRYRKRAFN